MNDQSTYYDDAAEELPVSNAIPRYRYLLAFSILAAGIGGAIAVWCYFPWTLLITSTTIPLLTVKAVIMLGLPALLALTCLLPVGTLIQTFWPFPASSPTSMRWMVAMRALIFIGLAAAGIILPAMYLLPTMMTGNIIAVTAVGIGVAALLAITSGCAAWATKKKLSYSGMIVWEAPGGEVVKLHPEQNRLEPYIISISHEWALRYLKIFDKNSVEHNNSVWDTTRKNWREYSGILAGAAAGAISGYAIVWFCFPWTSVVTAGSSVLCVKLAVLFGFPALLTLAISAVTHLLQATIHPNNPWIANGLSRLIINITGFVLCGVYLLPAIGGTGYIIPMLIFSVPLVMACMAFAGAIIGNIIGSCATKFSKQPDIPATPYDTASSATKSLHLAQDDERKQRHTSSRADEHNDATSYRRSYA